jgi:hypothetical protein
MSDVHQETESTRIEGVIAELKGRVTHRYPAATFDVFRGEDPEGTYLRAVVDIEDTDEVVDLIIDQLLPLQVEDRLPLYFVASRPLARTLKQLAAPRPAWQSSSAGPVISP